MESLKRERLRRYSYVVTAAMIVLCNGVFLLGLWGSGVKLDSLIRIPDPFNPMKDVCLRLSWHRVAGLEEPIRLCSEWINLSDPSGETHKFQKETQVVQGADGKLYFDHGARVDYRFFLFGSFVVVVIVLGISLKRYLIARYRERLGIPSGNMSSVT
jgi:hypothetical protein